MNPEKPRSRKILKIIVFLGLFTGIVASLSLFGLYLYITPNLPSIDLLDDVQLQEPLRVYSADNKLIAEYGEKKRIPLQIQEIPVLMRNAFIASEDDRFLVHPGVDYQGLIRAAVNLAATGSKTQGGSTITMQVARNFFLSREKTYMRKINEILLALRIEEKLNKDEILELYLNKIYLGKRAYGVASAAFAYYGKSVNELTLAEIAMIAGLPKAPSRYNPIVNPQRALERRNYVLGRMHVLGMIHPDDYEAALQQPISAAEHEVPTEVEAPYVAEMVRAFVVEQYGEEAYSQGLKIYTTIDSRLQTAANFALRKGLLDYEQRRGYKGPIGTIDDLEGIETYILPIVDEEAEGADEQAEQEPAEAETMVDAEIDPELLEEGELPVDEGPDEYQLYLDAQLAEIEKYGDLRPAIVTQIEEQSVVIYLGEGELQRIAWEGLSWASQFQDIDNKGSEPETAADILQVGNLIWVRTLEDETQLGLTQMPDAESAFVSLDPKNGSIKALVGGFDFFKSKFNRATQAKRQAGSSFKPFVYSAALENDYTAASIINDAPVVFDDPALEGKWRPENYSGKFYGPTRLRQALYKSRNLVSIRLLISLGIVKARRFASQFGFTDDSLPKDLSLVLGSGTVTPLELVTGFSVFANQGYKIEPFFIDRVDNAEGEVIYLNDYIEVCESCEAEEALQAEATEAEVVDESEATELASTAAELTDENISSETAESVEETTVDSEPEVIERVITPAERILEPRLSYIVNSILQDVVRRGTGVRARALGRNDLAGKTGTTNDQHDAWFTGYNRDLVATAWVGYDAHSPLGGGEAGSRTALPIWIEFMKVALQDMPESVYEQPEGIVVIRIDPETGMLADGLSSNGIFEMFRTENVPTQESLEAVESLDDIDQAPVEEITEELF